MATINVAPSASHISNLSIIEVMRIQNFFIYYAGGHDQRCAICLIFRIITLKSLNSLEMNESTRYLFIMEMVTINVAPPVSHISNFRLVEFK